jgi:hypothetical protein
VYEQSRIFSVCYPNVDDGCVHVRECMRQIHSACVCASALARARQQGGGKTCGKRDTGETVRIRDDGREGGEGREVEEDGVG